jgi:hypothetical protein
MRRGFGGKTVIAACGLALAIGTTACGGANDGLDDQRAPEEIGADVDRDLLKNEEPAVTLTGCLQRGDGVLTDRFVLTQVNHPAGQTPVATSGQSDSAASVERERLRAAASTYRLDGDDDQLEKMVGSQVRVTGMIQEQADLPSLERDADNRAGAGSRSGDRSPEVDTGDLAEIEVTSIEQIASNCGGGR